jgi:hypothetical protein
MLEGAQQLLGRGYPVAYWRRVDICELALHEAAHAIVARYLDRKIMWVEIEPDRGCGATVLETPWYSRTRQVAEENLIIAMAGSAAQRKANNLDCNRWTHEGLKDREIAYSVAREFALDPENFSRVNIILKQDNIWANIKGLSDCLIKCKLIYTYETEYF